MISVIHFYVVNCVKNALYSRVLFLISSSVSLNLMLRSVHTNSIQLCIKAKVLLKKSMLKKQLDFGLNDINKIIEDCFRNPLKLYTEKINTLTETKKKERNDIKVMFHTI